ncbi:MAG: tRNA (guanosine(37)-N1)-methyltransferase TrmD [bacterium]
MEPKTLHIDILTLFPGFFEGPLATSILGKAIEKGVVSVKCHDIRDWADGAYRQTDDIPYGGGPGMVLMPQPLAKSVEAVREMRNAQGLDPRLILLCPRGKTLSRNMLENWAASDFEKHSLLIVSGHYEGFDERIYELFRWEIVSLGDFVLSGGEIPALAIVDGVTRLIEGALGNSDSLNHESFNDENLLDHPAYTRPPEFRGLKVPEVLLGGNHAKIETWRAMKRRELTMRYRPDLADKTETEKTENPYNVNNKKQDRDE